MRWRFPLAAHLGIRSLDEPQFVFTVGSADPLDQIAYLADEGFSGVTDNGLVLRPPDEQRRIGAALAARGLTMGTFTLNGTADRRFAWSQPDAPVEDAVFTCVAAKHRAGGGVAGVIVCDDGRPPNEQLRDVVANLQRACEVAAVHGLALGLEPVSVARIPDALVTTLEEGAAIIRAVGHPSLRLIADTAHIALGGGDPALQLVEHGASLGGLQLADVPGRVEPGAGALDFAAIVDAIGMSGWRGLVEVESFASEPGAEGEAAVLRRLDAVLAPVGD